MNLDRNPIRSHEDVQKEILALWLVLEEFGPQLRRPRVDMLNGSRHVNNQELRFRAAGRFCWRRETKSGGAKAAFTAN
jgi:hypothetical protein